MNASFFWLIAPAILRGTINTLTLSIAVMFTSTIVGLTFALTMISLQAWARVPIHICSRLVMGVPPLMILLAVFVGLPRVGLPLAPFGAAIVGLTLYISFYFAEVFVSSFRSVDRTQYEASAALGLPRFWMIRRVLLPQMLPAALPSYFSRATEIVKGTSICAVVGYSDLATSAKQVIAATYKPIGTLAVVSLVYVVLNGAILIAQAVAERGAPWARART